MSLLSVRNAGKAYRTYSSEWQRFAHWFGMPATPSEEHWVLRHVNIDVFSGESIGIVGLNGAGKSTLLKLITGTIKSTEGKIKVNGRIAAILELGMGFNPELTGRQNAFHAAGLMGFSAEQIKKAMPDIEAFAEIGEYFDEPVRTYSSGMQVRVAFAVVTAFRPDIMIVDEALAVGDAAFQRKCFRRIESFLSKGTALLYVSHDVEGVKRLCERALYLRNGVIELDGSSKSVCDLYEKNLFKDAATPDECHVTKGSSGYFDPKIDINTIEQQYGSLEATISSVSILNESSELSNVIVDNHGFTVTYDVEFKRDVIGVKYGMMIKTVDGTCIYATNTADSNLRDIYESGDKVRVSFAMRCNLVPGVYYLNVGTTHETDNGTEFLHRRLDCLIFKVVPSSSTALLGYANLYAVPDVDFPS